MAVSTNMAICIAASICASAVVYFLLRSRMSVLEDTVATLCRAVHDSSAAQQQAACMNIPEAARTGAAIVNTVIARQGLIPVSDDDDSSYMSTSDEEDETPQGPLKTVTLTGGGAAGLGSGDLASIITSISGSGQLSAGTPLAVEHISREDVSNSESNTESDSDSENGADQASVDDVTDDTNMGAGEAADDGADVAAESLEGYDFTQYKVPELRAFVSQYQLAPNPTKLRKGELLDLLIEAQAS